MVDECRLVRWREYEKLVVQFVMPELVVFLDKGWRNIVFEGRKKCYFRVGGGVEEELELVGMVSHN